MKRDFGETVGEDEERICGGRRKGDGGLLLLSDGWLFVGRDFGENCWWR